MVQKRVSGIDLVSGMLLICLATVWGGSFFFVEVALREVPPLTIALHRIFWAVPVLLLAVWWQDIKIPRSIQAWFCYLVMGALNNALPFSLITWGQVTLDGGLASILNATTAFFGAIVAGIFLVDEPLTTRKLIGASFGLFGVAVIMGLDALTRFELYNAAQLAVLGAALSYAFASVWGKRFLSDYSPVMNALGMLIGAALLMIPLAVSTEGTPALMMSIEVWAAIGAAAVLSTAVAYLLYFRILVRAGSANLMLVTLLIPPVAVGLNAVFLGERMGYDAWVGFALIAVGLAVTDGRLLDRLRQGPE